MISVHSTICPGCSIGCGLYLMKNEVGCSVLHRKVSPVNAGKLCKFGMHLPRFYSRSRMRTTIKGRDAKAENAVNEMREQLTTMQPDEIAFIALPGMMTNEEFAAMISLCKSLKCRNLVTGTERFPLEMHPLSKIENAQNILLFFFDPFVQYPLITRRILRAKERGAEVIDVSFAENSREIADKTILVDEILGSTPPSDMGDVALNVANALVETYGVKDALIIADLNPMTDARFIDAIDMLSTQTFLLKPFLNANGAMLLSSAMDYRCEKGIFEIIDDVRQGKIKALYVFEPDLSLHFFSNSDLADIELLAVHGAFDSALCRNAHITISNEPFFMRRGTVVNVEGCVLDVGGSSCESVEIISEMSGERLSYEGVHEIVRSHLGFSKKSEYETFVGAVRSTTASSDAETTKKRGKKAGKKAKRVRKAKDKKENGRLLLYKTNPFFWYGIRDKNFVEISPETARDLHLFRGESIILRSTDGGEEQMSFKITDIPPYLAISEVKLAISSRILSPVEILKAGKRG